MQTNQGCRTTRRQPWLVFLSLALSRSEFMSCCDRAVCRIVDSDHESTAFHPAFDDGRERFASAKRMSSADYLCPAMVPVRCIVAVAVGVGCNDKVAVCLVQNRAPKVVAGPLP